MESRRRLTDHSANRPRGHRDGQSTTGSKFFPWPLRPAHARREAAFARHGRSWTGRAPQRRDRRRTRRENQQPWPGTSQAYSERDDFQPGAWRHGIQRATVRVHAPRDAADGEKCLRQTSEQGEVKDRSWTGRRTGVSFASPGRPPSILRPDRQFHRWSFGFKNHIRSRRLSHWEGIAGKCLFR